jgi:Trehalose utilisation
VFPTLVGMNRPAQRVCRGLTLSLSPLLRFNNRCGILDLMTQSQPHDGRGNLHCMSGDTFPLGWTRTYGDGKVFGLLLGHDGWSFQTPAFHQLVLNGVDWATTPTTRQV